jgi:hypothetical protein
MPLLNENNIMFGRNHTLLAKIIMLNAESALNQLEQLAGGKPRSA